MLESCQSNFGLNKFDYYVQPGVYYTQQTVSNLHSVCRIKRSRHLDLALFASKAAALIKFQTQTVFAVADTRRSRLMYKLNNRVDAYIERLQQRGSRVAFARLAQTILIICTAFPHVFSSHSVVNFYPLRSHPAFSLALTCDESERERAREEYNFAKCVLFLLRVKLLPPFPFQYGIVASRAPRRPLCCLKITYFAH
jgi:hypothetical protein